MLAGNDWQTNLGLGPYWAWSNLDNPDVLALELAAHGVASVTDLVGTGTANPIIALPDYLTRIFYRVKQFKLDGTFAGPSSNLLTLASTVTPFVAWPGTIREQLLTDQFAFGVSADPAKYYGWIIPTGFIYLGDYYPTLLAQSTSTVSGGGSTTKAFAAGTDIVGTFTLYGETCDIYGNLAGATGDIALTEDTLWP